MTRPSAATVIKYSFGQHMKQTKKKKKILKKAVALWNTCLILGTFQSCVSY